MRTNALLPVPEIASCSAGKAGQVLPVDIAAAKALGTVRPVEATETVDLAVANGRVLSRPVAAGTSIPPFDNSAMDGYAVSSRSFAGTGPWSVPVSGRLAAGDALNGMEVNEFAVRIMTGAAIPPGADTVIMQEHCTRHGDRIGIADRPLPGKHIRRAGEDVAAGRTIAERGQMITPALMALLAASGADQLEVFGRVRIGLLSTGTELVEPGARLSGAQVYNSNRYFLRAQLYRPWVEVIDFGIIADHAGKIREAVRSASEHCDILITTGGVSAGEEDHMLDVLQRENAKLEVLKVAMRPGKPVTVGRVGNSLYFGLPGNPYAAAITFSQIAWPAIRATSGMCADEGEFRQGISGFDLEKRPGRTEFVPVTWRDRDDAGRPVVHRLGRGSSASLHPLARAKAIAVLPAETGRIVRGDRLRLEPVCL